LVDGTVAGSPATTVLESKSASLSAGVHWVIDVTFSSAPLPGRWYYARTCFTPGGGSQLCGARVRVQAAIPTHQVTTLAATSVQQTSATVGATVTGPRVDGQIVIKWGTTTAYGHTSNAGKALSAARTGTVTRTLALTGLTRNTTYHYKGCYKFVSGNIITLHCGLDRSFKTLP